MKPILIIFTQEFRILLKDRQAIGLLFAMPLVFIVFLTLALQDVYLMKVGTKLKVDVIGSEDCTSSASLCFQLIEELKRFKYPVRLVTQEESALGAGIALKMPRDIDQTIARLKSGEALSAEQQVQLIFDPSLDQSVRALVQSHLLLSLQGVLIKRLTDELKQMDVPETGPSIANLAHFDGLVVERAAGGFVLPNPIQQTVPAWALFGMFFIVIPISNSMIRDRRLGIFKRLLSFPVSRAQLLSGKILPFFLINVFQFALMFAVGVFILPRMTSLQLSVDFSYGGLFLVTAAAAMAATAYGVLVSCLARTSEQASAFGALSVVILAVIGGVMIPRFVMPAFMQKFAMVSPLHWALEAYHDVIVRHADWDILLPKVAVLFGFAIICGTLAVLRFRWNEVE